ncbi:glycosyltransferase [Chloroflexota bacterium]
MIEYLPLVSIVTPTYNQASFLDETIQSVLNQDYSRIEYIVLDDGSIDNTQQVLEKYEGRIFWESHPNMGQARTVNKGWSKSRGDIIGWVNSDDPLLPGVVSEVVTFFEKHPDVLVVYPDWNMIGPDSEVIRHIQAAEYDYMRMLRKHECLPGPGAFFRRKILQLAGLLDPDFKYVLDYEFWLRAGLVGRFVRIPRTLATFRVHSEAKSTSHLGAAMAAEHVRLIEKFYAQPNLPQSVQKVRTEAFSRAYFAAGAICMSSGEYELGIKCYRKSMRLYPLVWFNRTLYWRSVLYMLPVSLYRLAQRCWRAFEGGN